MLIHFAVDDDVVPPRTGGAQRTFGLARGLARRNHVRLLGVVPNRSAASAEQRADGVDVVRRKAWFTSLAWRLDRWGVAPLFAAAEGHRRSAGRYLAALGGPADVLATDVNLSGLLAHSGARLKVHASQNVESDRFEPESSRFAFASAWRERLRSLERRAVDGADLVVACSDEDAARFAGLYGVSSDRLEVVPNGYDERELRPPTAEERARARAALGLEARDYAVVFVGSDWAPNRDALHLLANDVMPKLAGERIKLVVVGTVSRALAGRREDWLLVLGPVPDVLPLLHAADAGANPVRQGGGSNVKLPAYLAAGLAALTTPFGLRGYAPLAADCVLAEPAAAALADALRAKPRGWSARGASAPAALAGYAWASLGERLGERFESRLASRPAAAAARGAA